MDKKIFGSSCKECIHKDFCKFINDKDLEEFTDKCGFSKALRDINFKFPNFEIRIKCKYYDYGRSYL